MLVTVKEILQDADKNSYAVGAFNFDNMEVLQGIIMAAEQEKAPVIVQTTEGALKYAGLEALGSMANTIARKSSVPIALHLDHGTSYDTIIKCIAGGWTSVMIDGSKYTIDENISITKSIIKIAKAVGISVEAELGRLSGTEEQISVSDKEAVYTSPKEAKKFVDETNVDALAIAIGTAHGEYKEEPRLDFERLDIIKKLINIPIVLHGASGVPEDSIRKAVKLGVNKINVDTDIRQALANGIKAVFNENPETYDIKAYMNAGRENVTKVVAEKIRMFGSYGKA